MMLPQSRRLAGALLVAVWSLVQGSPAASTSVAATMTTLTMTTTTTTTPNNNATSMNGAIAAKTTTTTTTTTRGLQLGTGVLERFEVGESTIEYSGTVIKLVYPVSDLVPDGTIGIQTFSDRDCSVDITGNDYLFNEIRYDENPNPTGEKNREIEVTYAFDPRKIEDKDVWVEKDNGSQYFLSFCTATNLLDKPADEEGSFSMARLDTLVFIQVEFEGGFGEQVNVAPGDRLDESAQEIYLVDGFLCDENNERILTPEPFVQGVPVRVCVVPQPRALEDGIYMRRVDSFSYYRDKPDGTVISQEILRNGGSVDEATTELECERGTELCWFTTLLKGDFYYAPGFINGVGEAWLQFGKSVVRRRIAVDMGRSLQVTGGFANADTIEVNFYVVNEDLFKAEAYHCDEQNRRIEDRPPVFTGESVRICVAPDAEALDAGVKITSLDSFNFTRDGIMQLAIDGNAATEEGGSVIGCQPGSTVCAFHTILEPGFYPSVGQANGNGRVKLQHGEYTTGSVYVPGSRSLSSQQDIARHLQAGSTRFAGESDVEVPTPLGYYAAEVHESCFYEHEFHEWWLEEDLSKRYLYIGILTGAVVIASCCLLSIWLCPPFCWVGRDEDIEKEGLNDVKVNVDVKKDSTHESLHNAAVASGAAEVSKESTFRPKKYDVIFGDHKWPGTLDFFEIVCLVAEANPEDEYRPSIYREIKQNCADCEFYSKDVENGRTKQPTKQELIALIGKMYAEARILMNESGQEGSKGRQSSTDTTQSSTSLYTDMQNSRLSRCDSNKSMFSSMSSPDSLKDLEFQGMPDVMDVIFEDYDHPGTQKFAKRLLKVAREFPDEEYRPSIYRKIKRPFEANLFFVRGEREGQYKIVRKKELVGLIKKAFDEAKIVKSESEARSALGSLEGTIVVDRRTAEDVSVLGSCSFSGSSAGNLQKSSSLMSVRKVEKRSSRRDGTLRSQGSTPCLQVLVNDKKSTKMSRSNSMPALDGESRRLPRRGSKQRLHDLDDNEQSRKIACRGSNRSLRDVDDESMRLPRPGSNRSLRDLDVDKNLRLSRRGSNRSLRELDDQCSKGTTSETRRAPSKKIGVQSGRSFNALQDIESVQSEHRPQLREMRSVRSASNLINGEGGHSWSQSSRGSRSRESLDKKGMRPARSFNSLKDMEPVRTDNRPRSRGMRSVRSASNLDS